MASATEAPGCEVLFVVPAPGRRSILVVAPGSDRPGPGPSLPLARSGVEPGAPEIVDALARLIERPPAVLRANAVRWDAEADATVLLVETDVWRGSPSGGQAWCDLAGQVASIEPSLVRDALGRIVTEWRDGWSPLRPPYARPGWFARAAAWMVEQLEIAGRPVRSAPHLFHLWGPSIVLRADTASGAVFLKCSTDLFRHEASVTQALARSVPGLVPDVLAVEPEQGWLLMADLGGRPLGELPPTEWAAALRAHARLQRSWVGRTEELEVVGTPQRSLVSLADQLETWGTDAPLVARMGVETHERWLAALPELRQACRRLDALGPGLSLVHGDLHQWNVMSTDSGVRIFDWSDAAVSHPFIDPAAMLSRVPDPATRAALLDAYLAEWREVCAPTELAEARRLAMVVGSLYQVESYCRLLPQLLPDDVGSMVGADVGWVRRALESGHDARP